MHYYLFTCSFPMASKTLFWALFGQSTREDTNIVISNTCPAPNDTKVCYGDNLHYLTNLTGQLIYGLYHCFACLILLNMVIAIMSNSLTRIQVIYFKSV